MVKESDSKKILVVEDEAVVGLDIKTRLEKNGYFVYPVTVSCHDVLETVKKQQVDLMIVDINLGNGPDGIETIENVQQIKAIPHVYISAYGDESTRKRLVSTNPYGYILKPFEDLQLFGQIETVFSRIEVEQKLKQQNAYTYSMIQKTRNLKKMMVGSPLPLENDFAVFAGYEPCECEDSTIFDFYQEEEKIGFMASESSGENLAASLDSLLVKTIGENYKDILFKKSPSEFLNVINRDIYDYFSGSKFIRFCAGLYNTRTKEVLFANANCCPLYAYDGHSIEQVPDHKDIYIGCKRDAVFHGSRFHLPENGFCFFSNFLSYNDLRDHRQFYWDHFLEELRKMGYDYDFSKMPFILREIFKKHKNMEEQASPLSASHQKRDALFISMCHKPSVDKKIEIYTHDDKSRFLVLINKMLLSYNYSAEEAERVIIGLDEMLLNALIHGNQNDITKAVTVSYTLSLAKVTFCISDEGIGFQPENVPDPTDPQRLIQLLEESDEDSFTHGRGIYVSRQYMDEVSYSPRGNTVFITRYKERPFCEIGSPAAFETETPDDNLENYLESAQGHYLLNLTDWKTVSSLNLGNILRLYKKLEKPLTILTGCKAVFYVLKDNQLEQLDIKLEYEPL